MAGFGLSGRDPQSMGRGPAANHANAVARIEAVQKAVGNLRVNGAHSLETIQKEMTDAKNLYAAYLQTFLEASAPEKTLGDNVEDADKHLAQAVEKLRDAGAHALVDILLGVKIEKRQPSAPGGATLRVIAVPLPGDDQIQKVIEDINRGRSDPEEFSEGISSFQSPDPRASQSQRLGRSQASDEPDYTKNSDFQTSKQQAETEIDPRTLIEREDHYYICCKCTQDGALAFEKVSKAVVTQLAREIYQLRGNGEVSPERLLTTARLVAAAQLQVREVSQAGQAPQELTLEGARNIFLTESEKVQGHVTTIMTATEAFARRGPGDRAVTFLDNLWALRPTASALEDPELCSHLVCIQKYKKGDDILSTGYGQDVTYKVPVGYLNGILRFEAVQWQQVADLATSYLQPAERDGSFSPGQLKVMSLLAAAIEQNREDQDPYVNTHLLGVIIKLDQQFVGREISSEAGQQKAQSALGEKYEGFQNFLCSQGQVASQTKVGPCYVLATGLFPQLEKIGAQDSYRADVLISGQNHSFDVSKSSLVQIAQTYIRKDITQENITDQELQAALALCEMGARLCLDPGDLELPDGVRLGTKVEGTVENIIARLAINQDAGAYLDKVAGFLKDTQLDDSIGPIRQALESDSMNLRTLSAQLSLGIHTFLDKPVASSPVLLLRLPSKHFVRVVSRDTDGQGVYYMDPMGQKLCFLSHRDILMGIAKGKISLEGYCARVEDEFFA